jgi:hypothetical protein
LIELELMLERYGAFRPLRRVLFILSSLLSVRSAVCKMPLLCRGTEYYWDMAPFLFHLVHQVDECSEDNSHMYSDYCSCVNLKHLMHRWTRYRIEVTFL